MGLFHPYIDGIVTTEKTRLHLSNNANFWWNADSAFAKYSGLLGNITADDYDNDPSKGRLLYGEHQFGDAHITPRQGIPPIISVHANAGTGASASLATGSSDISGKILLTTGSGAWASGTQCMITFNKSYNSYNDYSHRSINQIPNVLITPANMETSILQATLFPCAYVVDGDAFYLQFAIPDSSSHALEYYYFVVGRVI